MDYNRQGNRMSETRFAMNPRADVPRSTFTTQHGWKAPIDASYLYPMLAKEVLPGDVHRGRLTLFARLATLLYPLMDRLIIETFFFFCPNRLVWDNWVKLNGQRDNPTDTISYLTPTRTSATNGPPVTTSLEDYFGLPTVGQVGAGNTITYNALPFRMYGLIFDEWFRDQNLQNSTRSGWGWTKGDGPDTAIPYGIMRRNKRPDYFTSALPWPLKGGVAVTLPLAGTAPVTGIGVSTGASYTAGNPGSTQGVTGGLVTGWGGHIQTTTNGIYIKGGGGGAGQAPQIYADLSQATGATLEQIRMAFQTQLLLERDARGGTRYTEFLQAHFGVYPEDSRLQRPEYIGGGRTDFQTHAIPQTSATGLTGGGTALGSMGAAATATDSHSFTCYAKEHGFIIGLINVRSQLSYQQGIHKKWLRSTRYDYYLPVFANLGEQAIQSRELYADGSAGDANTFGYQERWSEYRTEVSQICGIFRSTAANNIDDWHLAEQFATRPELNTAFIQDSTRETLSRVFAATTNEYGKQVLIDSLFEISSTRAMPMYSIPGMIARF